ncbi:MAG: hypothetical protein JXR51_04770 [Bacteroidales bacterium]|nr:hypothetical protein [Bacteroidales bacterium]MBN2756471.1 hypothetical protein [Bacteroidales bacterium]
MKKQLFFIIIYIFIYTSSFSQTNNITDIKNAKQYTFDGFKIGDNFGKMMDKYPYNQFCDQDPIDNKTRRFMCYAPVEHGGRAFPDQTTVVLYLKYAQDNFNTHIEYKQPIEAFAYLYGYYFNNKTDFSLKPSDDLNLAKKQFGEEIKTFDITSPENPYDEDSQEYTLKVYQFNGDIYIIADEDKIIGFVLGEMPSDPYNEQWLALMQMYSRYTPKD